MAPVDLHVAALLSASSISTTTNPTQPNLLLLFLLLVLIDALPEQIGYVVSEVLKRTVLASLMAAVADAHGRGAIDSVLMRYPCTLTLSLHAC